MALWHRKGYKNISNVEVVGIAGQTKTNIEQLQRKFRISRGYTDYKKLLTELKPDAVNITTPTHTHCPIALDSLKAGAHVLCEKPLALTLDETDMMIEAEAVSKKILMPGFSQRFFKEFIKIKQTIEQGKIGKIRVAWFRKGINMPPQKWYAEKGKTSGVTCELAIHGIDWLRWIIDSQPIQVSAELTESTTHPGIDDNIWIMLKFKNGAVGVVGASYAFPFLKRDIGVIGDKMALSVERSKVVTEKFGAHSLCQMFLNYIRYNMIIPYWLYYNPFEKELRHFIDCISAGTAPAITSYDGRAGLEIALAALESAKSGQKVTLPPQGSRHSGNYL